MENAEENKFHIFHGDHKINNLHSGEMMENICLQSETSHSGPHDGACKEENFPVDIEGYLVQQLSDRTEGIQNISQQEQIEGLDARVWEWSRGKEGNIRSLLSTLQYILWPESGWKQVPLVDIIEGPSVKKAYQKALLCLHPDKLQQKGASWNQKYIAEKVFDILQEAWEHFNSIGQF
ncbi:hypothetical protein HPP92_024903 [Vanilla planifolia]|uniref:J domain-containing protein n=1 Tax=Vanilla planifolia TaxID=51239 RepID=A0A835PNU9_VANPL|nr:hypothetical protein HPP92_024903 [Vanilla planifolia]